MNPKYSYESTVKAIRSHYSNLAEERFHIGALVRQALDHGAAPAQLAEDVGVHWNTLRTTMKVAEFWGDDRIPGTPKWHDYYRPFTHGFSDELRAEIKARCLAGDDPAQVQAWAMGERRDRHLAQVQANTTWLDDIEDALDTIVLALVAGPKGLQPPSSDQMGRVSTLLHQALSGFANIGITATVTVTHSQPTAERPRRRWLRREAA